MTSIYQKLIAAGYTDDEIRAEAERGSNYRGWNNRHASFEVVDQADDSDPIITVKFDTEGTAFGNSGSLPHAVRGAFTPSGELREDGNKHITFITGEYPGFIISDEPKLPARMQDWKNVLSHFPQDRLPRFISATSPLGAFFTRVEDPSTFTLKKLRTRWSFARNNPRLSALLGHNVHVRPNNKAEYVAVEQAAKERQTAQQAQLLTRDNVAFGEVGETFSLLILRADEFVSPMFRVILEALADSARDSDVVLRDGDKLAHFSNDYHMYQASDVSAATATAWAEYAAELEKAHAHFQSVVKQLTQRGIDVIHGPHVDKHYHIVDGEYQGFWNISQYPLPDSTQRVSVYGHYSAKDFLPGGAADKFAIEEARK